MEVAEAVAIVRRQSEQMAKLARILTRLKSTIYATGTVMQLRDSGADFHCQTEADAIRLAEVIPAKIALLQRNLHDPERWLSDRRPGVCLLGADDPQDHAQRLHG
jgi:hypothetical protein